MLILKYRCDRNKNSIVEDIFKRMIEVGSLEASEASG